MKKVWIIVQLVFYPLEITITIPRTASDLATTTYTYDVIDVNTPVDNTNGVNIVQNGPPGQSSSLFIRGTESDHSLITLNGIPNLISGLAIYADIFGFFFPRKKPKIKKGIIFIKRE